MNFKEMYAWCARVKAAIPLTAEAGSNRMASAFKQKVKIDLSKYPHPPHTRTPSPPGQPPGLISGELKESVLTVPAVPIGPGIWRASVGPHTVYAAIQEYGGPMHAHDNYMTWITDGRRYYRRTVILPPRPYMRPVADLMSRDGELTRAAIGGIASILYTVEGI